LARQQIWLPLLASAGIGAAAFYSMRRGKGIGQAVQKFVPIVAGMAGGNKQNQ
jgi:hypothetical protein